MQHFAYLTNHVVTERVDVPDGLKIGKDIYTSTFAAALIECDPTVKVGDIWDASAKAWKTAPPPPAPPVPDISRAQAKIQLRRAGLRDKVEEAVKAAGGEIADWYADAATWQRSSPYIEKIGEALEPALSPNEIDDLFRTAALIAA